MAKEIDEKEKERNVVGKLIGRHKPVDEDQPKSEGQPGLSDDDNGEKE